MELKKLEVKSDKRGDLIEAYKFPHDGQVFYVVSAPNQTRGNHYHKRKIEHFLVISGDAEIHVRDRKTMDVMKVSASGSNPLVATIYPNNTHNITAGVNGCIFMVWCDEIFDPENPDTFREEV